jgi:hypothetical protein
MKLEALRSYAARVWELVLKRADGPSSLAASLSSATELFEDHIDARTANGVRWGTRSMLVAALSHFPELGTKLELLGSGRNADLTQDEVDALWTQARQASDSLMSYTPLSVARDPPVGVGIEQWW